MTSSARSMSRSINERLSTIQFMMPRSPKDSPPTMKKKLCRLVNGAVNAKITILPSEDTPTMKPGRVVQDIVTSPVSPGAGSILKKGTPPLTPSGSPAVTRRVKFQPNVTVFLMSDEGNIFPSDSEELKAESANTRPVPKSLKGLGLPAPRSPPYIPNENTDICTTVDEVIESKEVAFQYIDDPFRGTVLKFVIALGYDYKPDDIVVKANVSGSRVRLVANKSVSYSDGSIRMEQLSKRFILPNEVDPYKVTARLDVRGQLTVEAPLLTASRKEALKRATALTLGLRDISNKSSAGVH